MRPSLQFLWLVAALMTAPVAGCSDPASPPVTGTLKVTTSTSGGTDSLSYSLRVDGAAAGSLEVIASIVGDPLDADGFTVIVAGIAKQVSGALDTLVFENLRPGDVPVSLAGIAPNCGVDGAPTVTAHIASAAQITIAFAVRCRAPGAGGEIRVLVNTTLLKAPAFHSFSVVLDRLRTMPVPANGAVSFTGVTAGTHWVRLNVAPYCSVGGFAPAPNPVSVKLPVTGMATVRFSVLCIG